jgi:hypothetical protein
MVNAGVQFQYLKRRAFGQEAKQAYAGARRYVEANPAEFMRRADGSFERFTSLGCYPIFYLTRQGNVVCAYCAAEPNEDDSPQHADVNWEDPDFYCDDCGERIESAYAEPEES